MFFRDKTSVSLKVPKVVSSKARRSLSFFRRDTEVCELFQAKLSRFRHQRYVFYIPNGPFPSCLEPLFQSEAKCETFHMKMSFHSCANETPLHVKRFALDLAVKQRTKATRKWLIEKNCVE